MSPDNLPADSAAQWLERVGLLRRKNDLKGALEECMRGLEALPDSPDLLMAYGEIRADKFNQTKNPDHLKAALVSFEKVLKMNPLHYMANLLAARIYFKGKAYDRVEEKLATLMKITPNDPRVLEIKSALGKARTAEKAPAASPAPAGEVKGHADSPLEAADTQPVEPPAEYATMTDRLSIFSRLEGMKSIHLVDFEGGEIKTIVKSGASPKDFSRYVGEIFRTSTQCARNAGLGNFQRGVIQTPGGTVMVVNVFYAALVIVMDPKAEMKTVEARVNRYLEAMAG